MLAASGGGGGYGGTDWNGFDVKYMWSAVEGHDTDSYFNLVTKGWQGSAELISTHISHVQDYRDNLAVAWPPGKSKASEAYIARLDELIGHLQETLTATSQNISAVRVVAQDLAVAQIKLKPILEQYEANEKLNLAWQNEKTAASASATPTPSATPSPSPAPSPVAPTPPVSSSQQEQLNNQARVIMFNLSSTVLSSHAAMQEPKEYVPAGGGKKETGHGNNGDDPASGVGAGGFIAASGASAAENSRSGGSSVTPTHASTPVTPSTSVPVGHSPIVNTPGPTPTVTTPGSGPVLGGVGPGSVTTPPATVSPVSGGLSPSGAFPGGASGGLPGMATPGLLPSGGLAPGGTIAPGGFAKPGALGAPITRTAMPSGGVIGARPGSGVIGQMPGAGNGGSRVGGSARVNPVGGVIGQQGSVPAAGANGRTGSAGGGRQAGGLRSAGVGGSTRSASGTMAGQPGRSSRKNEGREEATYWDPDNPWVTDEGVDPVLMPTAESGPIDPGPAIGYRR
ncbi:hypothetical protein [Winogradskya humida]|uniref:Uncharacterized protein n=1 Tax=Winogradskya humida TaxID=113566 RepID=A0ABQ3ZRK8_9ACTN|nr:hypothetical protein [Actinoplanes humidus]GIE21206.1 hypothetical protein Ahu01nite_043080 [Actinoplanes humidus]